MTQEIEWFVLKDTEHNNYCIVHGNWPVAWIADVKSASRMTYGLAELCMTGLNCDLVKIVPFEEELVNTQ